MKRDSDVFYIDTNRTKEPIFFSKLEYAKSQSHESHGSHRFYVPYVPHVSKKSYTLFQNLCLTLSKSIKNNLCLCARQITNLEKNDRLMSDLNWCLK